MPGFGNMAEPHHAGVCESDMKEMVSRLYARDKPEQARRRIVRLDEGVDKLRRVDVLIGSVPRCESDVVHGLDIRCLQGSEDNVSSHLSPPPASYRSAAAQCT